MTFIKFFFFFLFLLMLSSTTFWSLDWIVDADRTYCDINDDRYSDSFFELQCIHKSLKYTSLWWDCSEILCTTQERKRFDLILIVVCWIVFLLLCFFGFFLIKKRKKLIQNVDI